ncbi:helix-turn-helix transcriptional regulator [Streptomyces sp. NBS 14/10]|uniref:helix-turn-helix domain-containing protein n=1 Tax=Streptomyces sp. NBS 14/10 TaxID=1945643 RepID=UPI0015C5B98C|nr:helix-turn-helix transcriptional regulator [Streptomyces sp. NBS 14/10]KAK1183181.1 helix-turn-helix transcriptional regulator [Streptomyces sp. NBS 14/10]NUS84557.1 helix-turn-helix domain-containing protein [Streptomyces sp.]
MDGTDRSPDDQGSVGHVRLDGAGPVEAQEQEALVRQAAEAFAAELIRLRTGRGLSQSALARRMGYDKSYVTHVERCTQAPTRSFAEQADRVLGSGQALSRLWHAYHTARAARANDRRRSQQTRPSALAAPGAPDGIAGQDDAAARDTPLHAGASSSAPAAMREALRERMQQEQSRLLSRGVPGSLRVTVGDLLTRPGLLVTAPWRMAGGGVCRDSIVDEIFDRVIGYPEDGAYRRRRVLVLSDPGMGKTTLTYCLYVELLRNWSMEHRENTLPVRIDLRAVGTHLADQDFGSAEWLTRFLDKQVDGYDPVSWLGVTERKGLPIRPVLILDSLDEYLSKLAPSTVLGELNKFIFSYASLVCCRTQYFDRFLAHSPFGDSLERVELMEWGEVERRDYVCGYMGHCFPGHGERDAQNVRLRMESRPVRDLCHAPLRVNMALELMMREGDRGPTITDILGLYHAYVGQLLRIESAKTGSILEVDEKLDLLTSIAWHFYDEARPSDGAAQLFTLRELSDLISSELAIASDAARGVVEDLAFRTLLSVESEQFNSLEPTIVRFVHKSFQEYFVARHLFTCMSTDVNATTQAFRKLISAEVSEFVKEYLERVNRNSRVLSRVCDICFESFLDNSADTCGSDPDDSARARVARQQLAYYLGNLRSRRITEFLEEILAQERDLWIQRGIILGLAFGGTVQPLEEYVERLRRNRINSGNLSENEVNIGYTLTFFGDQATDEFRPEVDQGHDSCERTVRRLIYLVGTETDRECWRLNLLTLVELWHHRKWSRERYMLAMRECTEELTAILDRLADDPESASWPELEELRVIQSAVTSPGHGQ